MGKGWLLARQTLPGHDGHGELLPPHLPKKILKLTNARITHKHIKPPKRPHRRLYQLSSCRSQCYISRHSDQGRAGIRTGFGEHVLEMRCAGRVWVVVHDDASTVAQVGEGDGAADACYSAGDGGDFVGEEGGHGAGWNLGMATNEWELLTLTCRMMLGIGVDLHCALQSSDGDVDQ